MIQISVFCMLLSADINNLSSEKWQLWVIGGHLVVQTVTKSNGLKLGEASLGSSKLGDLDEGSLGLLKLDELD